MLYCELVKLLVFDLGGLVGEGEFDRQMDDLGLILVRFKRWDEREKRCIFNFVRLIFFLLHYATTWLTFTRQEHLFLSCHSAKFARMKRDKP